MEVPRSEAKVRNKEEHDGEGNQNDGLFSSLDLTMADPQLHRPAQVNEELDIPPVYQTLFLNGHELADGSATVAEIGLLLNDTLDLRQDQETDQTSDIEEVQKPRANEIEGFGGTLLCGFTTGTEGSDADEVVPSLEGVNGKGPEHPPSSSPTHDVGAKACPACTFDNSSQDKNCRICFNPLED